MINIEENKKRFRQVYERYKERIEIVPYPPEEIKKSIQIDPLNIQDITPEQIVKQQRLKMLKQKYEHTKRVVEIIEKMNILMDNNEFFKTLSLTAGLLHDYGRFIQAVYHNCYYDAEKFYKDNGYNGHGEVGYKILFEQGEIKYFNIEEKYYKLLGPVIKYHQLRQLKDKLNLQIEPNFRELTEKDIGLSNQYTDNDWLFISCMIQMVKDADMYDILYQRIINEYPLFTKRMVFNVNGMTIEEISKLTGVSIEEIKKLNNLETENINTKKIILPFDKVDPSILEVPQKIKDKFFKKAYMQENEDWDLSTMQNDPSYNYNSITAMWWTIGQFLGTINFTSTLQTMQQEKILEQIYNLYPDKYKYLVKEMFEFAQEELLTKRIEQNKIYAKTNLK